MTYDAFVNAVQEHPGLDHRGQASRMLTIVLKPFREILYCSEWEVLSTPRPNELSRFVLAANLFSIVSRHRRT